MTFESVCATYVLTDVVTGTFYIGSTSDLRARLYSHRSTLDRGCHDNRNFQRVYSGWHNIRIEYFTCADLHSARMKEESLLRFHNGDDLLANIGTGAFAVWGQGMPDEQREIIRESSRKIGSRPENKERLRRINFERPREDVLRNMALARSAQGPVSEETRRKMSQSWHDRGGISPETRSKMTESNRKREIHFTPDARAKQKRACQRPVMIDGIRYPGVTEAAIALGIGQTTVSYRLKSDRFETWIYLEKENE